LRTRRRYERFTRRLEVEFSANNQNYRGISSNFSEGGLFVRTNHAFTPGTDLDLVIHLPKGLTARLKGKVKMAHKTPMISLKNGMGVEITEKDPNYVSFIGSMVETGPAEKHAAFGEEPAAPETPKFVFVSCSECGVKNRLTAGKMSLGPRCGKCGAPLSVSP